MALEQAMERVKKVVDEDDGPIGHLLNLLSEWSGQTKLNIYLGGLGFLILLTAVVEPGTGGGLAIVLTFPGAFYYTLGVCEVGNWEEQGVWLLYWILHSVIFAVVPVPVLRLVGSLLLQHPATKGAAALYHACLRPFILLQHGHVHLPAFAALHPILLRIHGLDAARITAQSGARVQAALDSAPSPLIPLRACADAKARLQPAPRPISIVVSPKSYLHILANTLRALNTPA